MAWDQGKGTSNRQAVMEAYGTDLPTVNMMQSGTERMAQVIGRAPTLKTPHLRDPNLQDEHERRVSIVRGWDQFERFELNYPQIGRWLPGYSFVAFSLLQKFDNLANPYPSVKMMDSYDVYPGWFGADRQPSEMAHVRSVPLSELKSAYPDTDWKKPESMLRDKRGGTNRGGVLLDMSGMRTQDGRPLGWEGDRTGVEVWEYHDGEGTSVLIPEIDMQVQYYANPLDTGPAFVFSKRFSFDRDVSHYHHVIGLQSMMAKMNILGLVASEDSAFREVNIIGPNGGLIGGEYGFGRGEINLFEPGTTIDRPTGEVPNNIWAQIDRLERQLRIGAAYDVSQDGQSPNSFATGNAIRELRSGVSNNVREYHLALKHGIEMLDSKRLEWAYKLWRREKVKIFDFFGDNDTYVPEKDIDGVFRTRRAFGAMATWDDSLKASVGLQYLSVGVIDMESMRENVDGLEDLATIDRNNAARNAKMTLFTRLQARSEQDPKADAALVEIAQDPINEMKILAKYFSPEEPSLSPEEQALLMQQQGGTGAPVGPPPPVTTTLSRIESGGGAELGVQTVARAS